MYIVLPIFIAYIAAYRDTVIVYRVPYRAVCSSRHICARHTVCALREMLTIMNDHVMSCCCLLLLCVVACCCVLLFLVIAIAAVMSLLLLLLIQLLGGVLSSLVFALVTNRVHSYAKTYLQNAGYDTYDLDYSGLDRPIDIMTAVLLLIGTLYVVMGCCGLFGTHYSNDYSLKMVRTCHAWTVAHKTHSRRRYF